MEELCGVTGSGPSSSGWIAMVRCLPNSTLQEMWYSVLNAFSLEVALLRNVWGPEKWIQIPGAGGLKVDRIFE